MQPEAAPIPTVPPIEGIGVVVYDASGRVRDANAAFREMSGLDAELIREGRAVWPGVGSDATAAGGKAVERECRRPDGRRWWALGSALALPGGITVEYVIDVSVQRNTEAELDLWEERLDQRVLQRTAELDAANGALRDELLERKQQHAAHRQLAVRLLAWQEEERRRLSRELHDEVGQDLAELHMRFEQLASFIGDSDPARGALGEVRRLTDKIGKEIHELAVELRPTSLDDVGLDRTLAHFVEEWAGRTGIAVDFHHDLWMPGQCPREAETTLYRIIREAFTNILKHARATRVALILEIRGPTAVAIIEDNGEGFDPGASAAAKDRLGLLGMRERAELLGGTCEIESRPRGGTCVYVRLPLDGAGGKTGAPSRT